QAQRLLEAALQHRNLAQRLVADVAPVGVELVELLADLRQPRRMAQQLEQGPRRRRPRRVGSREHQRDEHAGDRLDVEARRAVRISDPAQHLEEILALAALALAALEDRLQVRDQLPPGAVALAERRQRQVGIHVRDRIRAALEIGEERDELGTELLAELGADQRATRRVDGELREELEQIDAAALAPAGDHALGLARNR